MQQEFAIIIIYLDAEDLCGFEYDHLNSVGCFSEDELATQNVSLERCWKTGFGDTFCVANLSSDMGREK